VTPPDPAGTIETVARSSPIELATDTSATSADDRRGRVLGLAAPVIGENLLQTLLGVVDTILVAGLGAVALAGVGTALQVIFVVTAALSALSVGASVLVAQAVGAEEYTAADRFARQSLIWSVVISLPLAAFGLRFTMPIIQLFGLPADVARVASDYLHVTFGTISAIVVLLIGGGVLRGAGDSRTPMLITLLANVINVGLAYTLIYGHFGMPALGAVGSAWATFLSRLVGAALLVGVLLRGRNGVRIGGSGTWRPQLGMARKVLKIGLPAALEEVLIITAFATLTPVVAGLGTAALAAHRVVINVLSLSFLPGIGFGLAATALVGQSVGANQPLEAQALARIALRWALIWMGVLGVIFLLFANLLMRLFTNDPQMMASGAAAVRVTALAQPLWAASFVLAGALRGTGNTRTPMLITGVAMWAMVGLAYLSTHFVYQSLSAIWAVFLFTGPLEVLCFWLAWRAWLRANL
jgi:MATE family multidrug resistance protein